MLVCEAKILIGAYSYGVGGRKECTIWLIDLILYISRPSLTFVGEAKLFMKL